jgi:hypothetical protein
MKEMKEFINITINPSYFPYWNREVPIKEVMPEYTQLSANDLLVLIANDIQIIGLSYAEDIGEECEIPGILYPMSLKSIHPVELRLLYEDNFNENHHNFDMQIMQHLKLTDSKRYHWLTF